MKNLINYFFICIFLLFGGCFGGESNHQTKEEYAQLQKPIIDDIQKKLIRIPDKIHQMPNISYSQNCENIDPKSYYESKKNYNTEMIFFNKLKDVNEETPFLSPLKGDLDFTRRWTQGLVTYENVLKEEVNSYFIDTFERTKNIEYILAIYPIQYVRPKANTEKDFNRGYLVFNHYLFRLSDESIQCIFEIKTENDKKIEYSYYKDHDVQKKELQEQLEFNLKDKYNEALRSQFQKLNLTYKF